MRVIKTVKELRQVLKSSQDGSKKVALVPTMGALHAGHLSLIKQAQKAADIVVVSIFVNPRQFGAGEDFSNYPRPEKADLSLLAEQDIQIAYLPDATEMYKPDAATSISVSRISEGLCGASRPGHFDGVALIVTKLLLQTMPDIAIFGEKDYQQYMVIRQLVSDLDIPVKILKGPILREKDGLAMSSRNVYLSAEERAIAPALYQTLQQLAKAIGNNPIPPLLNAAKDQLLSQGFTRIDYLECCDNKTLQPLTSKGSDPVRLLAAAYLGKTRLIDNIEVN